MIKTYALVGTGYRGLWSYCEPIVKEYSDVARLAAVCDINPLRARLVGEYLKADIPAYTDFDLMLREVRPDVDGATKLQQARYVTLPHLKHIIVIMLILSMGGMFKGDIGLSYNVTMNSGALYEVVDVIDSYVYRALKTLGNTGMSTAAGLYQSVVGFVLIIISNKIVRHVDEESALF